MVKESQGKKRLGLITLSLSSFVPKPCTPFQWTAFTEVPELKKRLKLVTREFHGVKEVRVHTDLPKWAYVQALMARGDRRVGDILLTAHERGWTRAFRENPVNPDFFTLRERRPQHPTHDEPGLVADPQDEPTPGFGNDHNRQLCVPWNCLLKG